jgi:tRNA(adenine34) deaminase
MTPISIPDDTHFMRLAIQEAFKAQDADEVPIGAVVTLGHQVIARGYNQTQLLKDSTAHAEMIALTSAFSSLNNKYLRGCTLYVTLEPCPMCAGALKWSQIGRVVYGATDIQGGYSIYQPSILHPKTSVMSGVEQDTCQKILQDFFVSKRR